MFVCKFNLMNNKIPQLVFNGGCGREHINWQQRMGWAQAGTGWYTVIHIFYTRFIWFVVQYLCGLHTIPQKRK